MKRYRSSSEMDHLAQSLLSAQPGRAPADIFENLARVYYGEQEMIGRKPKFEIFGLGAALGMDPNETQRLTYRAKTHVEAGRRVETGGRAMTLSLNRKRFRWVLEDETGKTILREA